MCKKGRQGRCSWGCWARSHLSSKLITLLVLTKLRRGYCPFHNENILHHSQKTAHKRSLLYLLCSITWIKTEVKKEWLVCLVSIPPCRWLRQIEFLSLVSRSSLARDRVLKTNSTLSNLPYLPQHLLKNNSVRMGRLGKIEP